MKLFFEYLNFNFVNKISLFTQKKKRKEKIKRDGEPKENPKLDLFCFFPVNKMGQVLR